MTLETKGISIQPLGGGGVAIDVEADIATSRKIRNACISGHMPGEEKRCPLCREARFNTLTSGHYSQAPNVQHIKDAIARAQTQGETASDDYRFMLEYLGIPPNHTDPTSLLVTPTPAVVGCSISDSSKEVKKFVVDVPAVKPLLLGDIHGRHSNISGKTSMLLAMLTSTFQDTSSKFHIVPFHYDPFVNRAERRKKKNKVDPIEIRVLKANGPVKHGDRNGPQYIKDIKPSGLLKKLVKKTEG